MDSVYLYGYLCFAVDYSGTTPPVGTGELINLGKDTYTPEPAPADSKQDKTSFTPLFVTLTFKS